MKEPNKFPPEVRERAVHLAEEHRGEYPSLWAAIKSIAVKIVRTADLARMVTQARRDSVKVLERKVKVRRANKILKLTSAFFAQAELDRRCKSWGPLSINTERPTGSSRTAPKSRLPRRNLPVFLRKLSQKSESLRATIFFAAPVNAGKPQRLPALGSRCLRPNAHAPA